MWCHCSPLAIYFSATLANDVDSEARVNVAGGRINPIREMRDHVPKAVQFKLFRWAKYY